MLIVPSLRNSISYHLPTMYLPINSAQESATSLTHKPTGPAQLCLQFASSVNSTSLQIWGTIYMGSFSIQMFSLIGNQGLLLGVYQLLALTSILLVYPYICWQQGQ